MKTIKYIVLSLLMGSPGLLAAFAQQTDTIKYVSPVKIEKFNGTAFHATKKYFDGFGRPVQSIDVGASAQSGRDVISFVEYDNMGREDATTYLPYVVSSAANNGNRVANPVVQQQAFYQNLLPGTDPDRNYAYAQKQYDNSPLSMVEKVGSVGQSNNLTVGKPINYEYKKNGANEIKKFTVNSNGELIFKGYYPANTLMVRRTYTNGTGMEDSDVYEYTDPLGQVIAKESRISGTDRRMTYYVCDDLGHQRYVIPPIQESLITAVGSAYNFDALKKYCYYTEYDGRDRPIREWAPGQGKKSNVYDVLGRAALSQTNRMSQANQWTFIKYDTQNRPVISGIIVSDISNGSSEMVSDALQAYLAPGNVVNYSRAYEERGTALHGYTNNAYPTNATQADVLNVTYYDDYDWITDVAKYGFSTGDAIPGTAKTTKSVTSMTTGKKTKVLGIAGDQWLTSVIYYDKDYNAIQTVSDLYPSGIEITSNKYNFNGQVIQTKVKQVVDGVTYEYNKWFDYDAYGRLLKIRQKITGDPQNEVVLAEYAYDDLGQLVSKKIHGGKEETAYAYDIAGRTISSSSPSFSYRIGFDKSLISGVAGRTDGLISQVTWSNNATGEQKAYAYTYDKTKQYLSASYYEKSGASWVASQKYKETIGSYDKAGNILSLQRNNASGAALHNYTYTYGHPANGYALTKVSGSADFGYDANGNMIQDGTTGVQIEYNILDLPGKIYKGSDQITYIYSAQGEKLASQTGSSLTYYRSVMVYSKNGTSAQQLSYMLQPEGLVGKEGSAWVYKYFKADYLGNTRALLAVRNGTLVNEGQNTDYYPLGYAHSLANLHLNKYLYGGKEYQGASLGGAALGMYDFEARFYNPLYGRWFNPDPANQFANPYIYCGNNPVMYADPNGESIVAAIIGAAISVLSNGISNIIHDQPFFSGGAMAAFTGAFGGAMSFGIGESTALITSKVGKLAFQTGMHAYLGGAMTGMSGGDFFSGALSGAVGSLGAVGSGALLKGASRGAQTLGTIGSGAVLGGVGSSISGGNFWDGFRNGAISSSLNHGIHSGLFGRNLMMASVTGKFRHLWSPDAIAIALTLDAASLVSLSAEKGKLIVLRGTDKGVHGFNDLGVGVGAISAAAGVEETYLYSSADEVKLEQFYGPRVESSITVTVCGVNVGVVASMSYHKDGVGYTIGLGTLGSLDAVPLPLKVGFSLNKGASTEHFRELVKEWKKPLKPEK